MGFISIWQVFCLDVFATIDLPMANLRFLEGCVFQRRRAAMKNHRSDGRFFSTDDVLTVA